MDGSLPLTDGHLESVRASVQNANTLVALWEKGQQIIDAMHAMDDMDAMEQPWLLLAYRGPHCISLDYFFNVFFWFCL